MAKKRKERNNKVEDAGIYIYSPLSSIFTHSVQDVKRHVLLPVMKEKTSSYKLYICLQKEGSFTDKSQRIISE